ncbi:MAG: glycosyltransferase [Niallia nealsonii]|nr:glycosyltransferase [Niallia nealsonii]
MKKTILIICESLGGGVRKHIVDILMNIDKDKFNVHLIYSSNRADKIFFDNLSIFESDGVKLYNFPEMQREISIFKDVKCLIKIIKLINNIKPSLIHCHSSKAGLLGRIAAFILRKKALYTPHAYYAQNINLGKIKRLLYILFERALSKLTYKTINVSYGENRFAIKNNIVNEENSIVILNGLKKPELNDKSWEKNDDFIVGNIARVDTQKNPYLFISIAEYLIKENLDISFVFAGDGPLFNEVKAYVKKKKLDSKITFTGFTDKPIEVLSKFDVYLSSSNYEGLPYSVIEAMALKKPLVLTDVIGHTELVKNNYNGQLFKLNDVKAAALVIKKLYTNRKLYDEYSKNSCEYFDKNYTIDKMIMSLEKLYLSI